MNQDDRPPDGQGGKEKTRDARGRAPRVAHATDVFAGQSISSIVPTPPAESQAPFSQDDRSTEQIAAEAFLALKGFCRSLGELLNRLALPDRGVLTLPAKLLAIESLKPVCQHRPKPASARTHSGKPKRGCDCATAIKSVLRALIPHERDDGSAYPSGQQLAETAGKHRPTVLHWLAIAEAAGYIAIERREAQTNRVTIRWSRILEETRNDFIQRLISGGPQ